MMPTKERVAELLAKAPSVHIAVIGDVMLDVYIEGDVERISPEAPVPVVKVRERRECLGGAGNVAQNVAALGAKCSLVSVVGEDAAGDAVRALLQNADINENNVFCLSDRQTTIKTRIVARGQQVVRFDSETVVHWSFGESEWLAGCASEVVESVDAVAFADYAKGMLNPIIIDRAIFDASRRNIPTIADPKFPNLFAYKGVTVYKPNRLDLASPLASDVGAKHVLMTAGASGMFLDGRHIPAVGCEVADVTGAGDTVTAWLAVLLACGGSIEEAARIANVAAGVKVGKHGAQSVSPAEVLAAL